MPASPRISKSSAHVGLQRSATSELSCTDAFRQHSVHWTGGSMAGAARRSPDCWTSERQCSVSELDVWRAVAPGRVLPPTDEPYAGEPPTYTLPPRHTPAVVVGAANADDVRAAVRYAAGRDLPV